GEHKQILNDTKFNILQSRWSLDGNGIYLANSTTTDPRYVIAGIIEIFYYDLKTATVEKLDLGWENGITEGNDEIGSFAVFNNGVVALLANGVKDRLARYTREGRGWRREWLSGEHSENILAFDIGRDGKTLVYDHSTASKPTQLFCAQLTGATVTAPVQI